MTGLNNSQTGARIGDALKRAWLRQLSWEYHQLLSRPALKRLRPAVLSLSSSEACLGRWHPAARLIAISEKLIENSAWEVVLGVLAHETAHQIADELLGPNPNARLGPHGDVFQTACDLLGLDGPYRRPRLNPAELEASGKTWENGLEGSPANLMNRVKKLLALAASPVRAEAETAMLKAARLMARHNLEPPPCAAQADYQFKIINTGRKRLSAVEAILAGLLAEFYFVEVVLSSVYNPRLDSRERTLEIFGKPENVIMAVYVYDFILASLARLWPAAKRSGLKSQASFRLGLLEGFRARLNRQNQNMRSLAPNLAGPPEASLSSLALAADSGLKDFIKKRRPRLRLTGYRGRAQDSSARRAGFQAGLDLVIHRPLAQAASGEVAGLLEDIRGNDFPQAPHHSAVSGHKNGR